jgi:hypothetical protein
VEKIAHRGKRAADQDLGPGGARSFPSSSGTPSRSTTAEAFIDVFCTEDMVGHKLGEFSITRTFRGHTNKKEGIEGGSKSE